MEIKKRSKLTKSEIARYLGDSKKAAADLRQYTKDCIYAENSEFRKMYEGKWIVVYKESVQATGPTLDSVMKRADAKHLPRGSVVVRFQTEAEPPVRYFSY